MGILKDELGNRYGMLTIVERAENNKNGHARWLCSCDCGKTTVVGGVWLRRGECKSCGCKGWTKLLPGEAAFRSLYAMYKYRGKTGSGWGLSRADFRKITKSNCHYCGASPATVAGKSRDYGTYTYNGVDRIDNLKGYFVDNVVPCCPTCNYAKRETPIDEFYKWVNRVYKYSSKSI